MINELIERYPALSCCKNEIEKTVEIICAAFENGGKLLICGNGGSCADCDHIVGELMKGFLKKRRLTKEKKQEMMTAFDGIDDELLSGLQGALPAISLPSFTALNSAFLNDEEPSLIYAQAVLGLGCERDVLLCISTSGNSKNVVSAAKVAKAMNMTVISLTGMGGGKLFDISDVTIAVPEKETFKVQELHLPIYHCICAAVEEHFFKE
ncbi:MAG: SIS domain-containing protein [Clostridia bacterium]|nr:SIS domain-containing protein [Clostridia bacterium]